MALNRLHISNTTGVTAFQSLRGRPYKGKLRQWGQEVFAINPIQK